ncbi:unnamed protein product [Parascedosporium putredinis]|uniref:Uncharacterized protein n=1 Tax=Parascedosporium putredinis TaxID=1442378 RepID=A0A9P1MB38_9PEZI|nr:unnamed protein product [Parascedosporium putredinis]CAI7995510.1 unnamed protein product [Parascedosporium putredinis]
MLTPSHPQPTVTPRIIPPHASELGATPRFHRLCDIFDDCSVLKVKLWVAGARPAARLEIMASQVPFSPPFTGSEKSEWVAQLQITPSGQHSPLVDHYCRRIADSEPELIHRLFNNR